MQAFQLHHLCSRPYRTQSPLRLALSTPVIDDAANICLTRGAGLGHFYRVTHSFTHSLSLGTLTHSRLLHHPPPPLPSPSPSPPPPWTAGGKNTLLLSLLPSVSRRLRRLLLLTMHEGSLLSARGLAPLSYESALICRMSLILSFSSLRLHMRG